MSNRPLSLQQKAFCKFKAQGYSNEESSLRAGYAKSYARDRSYELSANPRIKAEIANWKAKADEKADEIFAGQIRQKLMSVEELLIMTQGIATGEKTSNSDKLKATELLMKAHKVFTDGVSVNNDLKVDDKQIERVFEKMRIEFTEKFPKKKNDIAEISEKRKKWGLQS